MTPTEFLLEINGTPQAGDAIVWRKRGDLIGAAIRFAQRGQWEHVSCPHTRETMIEAHWPGGVRENSMTRAGEWAYLRLRVRGGEVRSERWNAAERGHDFARRYWAMLRKARDENWPYDLTAIWGAMFNRAGWQSGNPRAVICSELLATCLENGGLHLWERRVHRPWPQTIFECPAYEVLGGFLRGRFIGRVNARAESKAEFLALL